MGVFTRLDESDDALLAGLVEQKARAAAAGFFDDWSHEWHEAFISSRYPQNYATLYHDDSETAGHNGSGIYVVQPDGYGFAKNAFVEETGGQESFGLTPALMRRLADLLGRDDEECRRIELAFYADTLDVGACLVVPDMPIFVNPLTHAS